MNRLLDICLFIGVIWLLFDGLPLAVPYIMAIGNP